MCHFHSRELSQQDPSLCQEVGFCCSRGYPHPTLQLKHRNMVLVETGRQGNPNDYLNTGEEISVFLFVLMMMLKIFPGFRLYALALAKTTSQRQKIYLNLLVQKPQNRSVVRVDGH